jgi:hypothetical protein
MFTLKQLHITEFKRNIWYTWLCKILRSQDVWKITGTTESRQHPLVVICIWQRLLRGWTVNGFLLYNSAWCKIYKGRAWFGTRFRYESDKLKYFSLCRNEFYSRVCAIFRNSADWIRKQGLQKAESDPNLVRILWSFIYSHQFYYQYLSALSSLEVRRL